MEDFCQLDLRLTQDKYRGSYERCAKIIGRYSIRKGLDMTELYLRLIFSFLVGNSDMHLKNFSLIETDEGSGDYVLSPAYDLTYSNSLWGEHATSIHGNGKDPKEEDLLAVADMVCMSRPYAEKTIRNVKECVKEMLGKYLR